MTHLILSFASGIVRPMLATVTRPSSAFGKFHAEAVTRCKNMGETAKVIDKDTYTVLGEVVNGPAGYTYVSKDTP